TFLDDAHVLLMGGNSDALVYDVAAGAGVYHLQSERLLLSPDAKILASSAPLTHLFNALTGESLGDIAGTDPWYAINHAGTRFVSIAANHIRIWDLATGQMVQDSPIPTIEPVNPIWISDNFILVGEYVFSVKKGTFIYRYTDVAQQ